jgi:hypothetical protein
MEAMLSDDTLRLLKSMEKLSSEILKLKSTMDVVKICHTRSHRTHLHSMKFNQKVQLGQSELVRVKLEDFKCASSPESSVCF